MQKDRTVLKSKQDRRLCFMKIALLAFYSGLQASESQVRLSASLSDEIAGIPGWSAVVLNETSQKVAAFNDPDTVPVILSLSGGIEGEVLSCLEQAQQSSYLKSTKLPIIILAHPHANSLPASLEILARLNQMGRPGRIVFTSAGYLDELQIACRVLETHRTLAHSRIGVIGTPSDWLVASIPDAQTVRSVWGPELVEIPIARLIELYHQSSEIEATKAADAFAKNATACLEPDRATLIGAAKIYLALQSIVAEYQLAALTIRCFDLLSAPKNTGCFALAQLNSAGITASCEGDIPALLTMMLIKGLSGQPAFMANPSAINALTGEMIAAHCTIPITMINKYTIRSHFESGIGAAIQGDFPPGPVTVARIGGKDLTALFVAEGQAATVSNPQENLCRTQVKLTIAPEKARQMLEKPLGNHHILASGALRESIEFYYRSLISR